MEAQDVEPSQASAHPTERDLECFARGGLTRSETRAVVRHLLAGCEECRAVTRRLWGLGALPGERSTRLDLEGEELMNETEAAQGEIREVLRELKRLKLRLSGVVASLPPSPAEASPLLDVEPTDDPKTAIRSVVECVVSDSLEPAIRDLERVAGAASEPEGD